LFVPEDKKKTEKTQLKEETGSVLKEGRKRERRRRKTVSRKDEKHRAPRVKSAREKEVFKSPLDEGTLCTRSAKSGKQERRKRPESRR